jgi:uncharacterized coiled-coil DUF342 family protein
MKKILALLLLSVSSLIAEDWRVEIKEIDAQIKELQDERTKLLGRANRFEDNAQRWQFMPDQANESRRAYKQADVLRNQAKTVQTEIDRLEQKKEKILQQHQIVP